MADNVLTADDVTTNVSQQNRVLQNLIRLNQKQKIAIAASLAFGVALIIGLWMWSSRPDYAVLFSNLEQRDGGEIIASLQRRQIPYKFSEGGDSIMVPSNSVHDLRLQLAAEGLPKGGLVGFELMENQKLGVSQFHEQINFQRALEGELSRTIQSIAAISSARVHLAIPKRTAFLRDREKPTASVLINLFPGRTLDSRQVAGIVHLIAASVPELSADAVSIIDQTGNLLTGGGDKDKLDLDPTQIKYSEQIEQSYMERIRNILVPIVGEDNFRTQVTADIDFNRSEQTAETYKPNPQNAQAIRSQQSNDSRNQSPGAGGVPGALTNQPPVPATAPIVNPAPAGANAGNGNNGQAMQTNSASTINYELDRTISHVKQAVGQVKRLSVAVVINHKSVSTNGKSQSIPLSDQEIDRITKLVREAVGFDEKRGDSLNVTSSQFAVVAPPEIPEMPIWKNPETLSTGKEVGKYLILFAALFFVWLKIFKPIMQQINIPKILGTDSDGKQLNGPGGAAGQLALENDGASVKISPRALHAERLARLTQIVREDPKAVSNQIKEWLNHDD